MIENEVKTEEIVFHEFQSNIFKELYEECLSREKKYVQLYEDSITKYMEALHSKITALETEVKMKISLRKGFTQLGRL